MSIRINRKSEVPIREQLVEQVIYQIATGAWRAGAPLPSVRELARRLGIHHNTVSDAYSSLVERGWLVRRRGSRLQVRSAEQAAAARATGFDELVEALIHYGRQQRWSLDELRARVADRLAAMPADHVLLVEAEDGLRGILQAELQDALRVPVKTCSLEVLAGNPALMMGAQIVAPNYLAKPLAPLTASGRPPVELRFGSIDAVRDAIRSLAKPSVIAIASVSPALLLMARALFGPAEQRGHSLAVYTAPLPAAAELRAADLLFCDVLTMKKLRSRRAVELRILHPESLQAVAAALK
jgi:DNA-binding transcriptional regulator YhcF (GntR family)